jgi:large subunit ribosomal protein L22
MTKKAAQQHDVSTGRITVRMRYVRMAPRKVRHIADLIKQRSVDDARALLTTLPHRAASSISKLLQSGISGAQAKKLNTDALTVANIRVDGGPMTTRWMPRAMGRATPIQRKTSHITLTLQESAQVRPPRFIFPIKEKKKKKETPETPHKHPTEKDEHMRKHEHEKEPRVEAKTESPAAGKGFIRRIFRRKSV